ncbi:uncharacterized protein LOC120343960 [Styela clava]
MMRDSLMVALICVCFAAIQVQGHKKTCAVNFGGCDKSRGYCWNTDKGKSSMCSCKSGYRFRLPHTRRGTCVDINECRANLHSCDTTNGRCINTLGSHRCSCKRGFVLDYTKTKCLRQNQIKGTCSRRRCGKCRNRSRYDAENPDEDAVKFWTRFFKPRRGGKRGSCVCEPGFAKRRGCKYCQDINECRLRISMCDLRRGHCHNSDGGYFCTCKNGYLLGPCGFKCYRANKRPSECNSEVFQSSRLANGDSDGLNDETTKAVLLDHITEKIAKLGGRLTLFHTLLYKTCKTGDKKRVQIFDVNHDGKDDIVIHYVCAGNIWNVKAVFDTEARWSPWTCWTSCKPTCTGGIQTRVRICKYGLVGEGKCKGPATQYKTCYTGKKCALRVRREAHSLNTRQQKDLIQAMEKYKKDSTTFGFHNAGGTHEFPFQCMGSDGKDKGCCFHGAKLNFLMWHRAELLNFEEGLTRHLKDKTLGLPYWDWLTYPNPPPLVWSKKLFKKDNPFTSMTIRYDVTPNIVTQRSPTVDPSMVKTSKDNYYVARKLMQSHSIHEFSEALESAHNTIHLSICWGAQQNQNKCTYSMAGLTYAAFDPVFFFHHTNIDRLFSVFQDWMSRNNELAWTRQSVLEPQENIFHFNQPYLPFNNHSLTPFKKLHAVSNIQDLFFNRQLLGYRYDSLKVPKQVAKNGSASDAEKAHIPSSADKLMLGQYERSIRTNVKITYFLANKLTGLANIKKCSKLNEDETRFLASAQILGSRRERSWKSRQPTIVNINHLFGKLSRPQGALISPTSNVQIRACYSHNLSCRKNCKQIRSNIRRLIPSPQLILYPKNIRTDVQKIEWAKGVRLPTWTIDAISGTKWFVFWGKEAKDVVQVPNRSSYLSCNTKGARKVNCETACVLPSGMHYFVHKTRCRRGMKLSILAHV